MRKLVVSEFVALDGVMEAPGGEDGYPHGAWTVPYWCDDLGVFKTAELRAADSLLLGRVSYQGFSSAWPSRRGDPFSDKMNAMPKHVVSSTLGAPLIWNAELIEGDPVAAVTALKEGEGGDILVAGSGTLAKSMLRAGLVDELRLAVYPLTLGEGKRLFDDAGRNDLELVESSTTPTGVNLLVYRRAEAGPAGDPHPFAEDMA
jgi:dihydrofolate reductase